MTSNVQPTASTPSSNASAGAVGMRSEIEAKWGKFSATEVADLKDKDDLVAKVQTKYSLDKVQAQKDVDTFAKGRQL